MDSNDFEARKQFFDSFLAECLVSDVPNSNLTQNSTQFNLFDHADDNTFFSDNFFEVNRQQPSTSLAPFSSLDTPYGPIEDKYDEIETTTLCSLQPAAAAEYVNQRNYANTFECPVQSPLRRTGVERPITQSVPSRRAPMAPLDCSSTQTVTGNVPLREITEIPTKYRNIFREYPHFNTIQSIVFDQAFYSDTSVVVTAPTGSGKTVIFELAIVRLLHRIGNLQNSSFKIVYLAPLKALCTERKNDWQNKFGQFNINCFEITGDTDAAHRVNNIAKSVKLFLIDEVHCLNNSERGATIEAVVSRMKTINMVDDPESDPIRFLAVSATIPNPEDIAEWLGERQNGGAFYKLNNDLRPVKLETHVIGYPCQDNWSDYRFDIHLNYKLLSVIQQFSNGQPTLVFSATRKSAQLATEQLSNGASFVKDDFHKTRLISIAGGINDYQHDRKIVENAFVAGDILVLVATSTLAMGVNLPAHLVIIKSTFQYVAGNCVEYSETQILQMIGRAGRPQYDTSAVAVIMTKSHLESKYKKLITGEQTIESTLHKHLAEHLNVEIVLGTIKSFWVAMEWMQSTYLYVRVFKNPQYYDIDPQLPSKRIENKIQEWCTKEMNGLKRYGLITMDEDGCKVNATAIGCLVAKYFIKLETVRKIASLKGHETMSDLLQLVASCADLLVETSLRVHEKKYLNAMNSKDKNQPEKEIIRFPLEGKIRNTEMKINCLIQAAFGCLPVPDQYLSSEITKILKTGTRITQFMSEYLQLRAESFTLLVNAIVLAKCFRARTWENTIYVARQFDKICIPVARAIADGGLTSLTSIEQSDPGTIEMFANRKPPLGSQLHRNVKKLPRYRLQFDQLDGNHGGESANIQVTVTLENFDYLSSVRNSNFNHGFHVIVGNQKKEILFKQRVSDSALMGWQGEWSGNFVVEGGRAGEKITCHLISDTFVGIDVTEDFVPQCRKLQETQDYMNQPPFDLCNIVRSPEKWAHLCSSYSYCKKPIRESSPSTPIAKRFKKDSPTSSTIPGKVELSTITARLSSNSEPKMDSSTSSKIPGRVKLSTITARLSNNSQTKNDSSTSSTIPGRVKLSTITARLSNNSQPKKDSPTSSTIPGRVKLSTITARLSNSEPKKDSPTSSTIPGRVKLSTITARLSNSEPKKDSPTPSMIRGTVTWNPETSRVSGNRGPMDQWLTVRKRATPSATISKPPPDNNDEEDLDHFVSQMPSRLLSVNIDGGGERLQELQKQPTKLTAIENGSGDGPSRKYIFIPHTPGQNVKKKVSPGGVRGASSRGKARHETLTEDDDDDDTFGLKLLHSMLN